jgi:coproporphyrinogen III oxidase-like Fe-S oxidoreductase
VTAALAPPAPAPRAPLVDRDRFGVYVHVPFCSSRCHYCDFVTYTGMEGLRRPYAAALLAEADLAAAGVTRVSMGAQSFDDRVLAALGRTHGAARVAQALAALRAAGVPAVNLDLIYGCPGEDDASWAATLDAAVALGPEHLSAYALGIEPATRFGRLVASGQMAAPDDDLLADRYEAACAALATAGYAHYEVSNWARGPAHAGRHNLTYWRRGRYLGLGAGAHEFDGATRSWNVAGVPAYLAAVRAARRPTAGREHLDAAEARFEALALRLRTAAGLDPAEARALGADPAGAAAAELRDAGLLAPGPRLRLTERGMFLHGEVVARLAPD